MPSDNYYQGLIFTNHALERIKARGITKKTIKEILDQPDCIKPADNAGAIEVSGKTNTRTITAIARKNQNNQWVIITCFMDPPLTGTPDYYEKQRWIQYKKAGFFKKILLNIIKQLGLQG